MQKRQGVLAQRANLRGQLFDAVALGAALGAPIKAAIDFESAMSDVRKVVNFDTPDGLQKLGETLKIMSREIPLSAAGLAQIAASDGQLGIAAKDLAAFTNIVAKMATAFDMSAEEAGDSMAKPAIFFSPKLTHPTIWRPIRVWAYNAQSPELTSAIPQSQVQNLPTP